jgi:hypothetical protein
MSTKKIAFVTGNNKKLQEVEAILGSTLPVEGRKIDRK